MLILIVTTFTLEDFPIEPLPLQINEFALGKLRFKLAYSFFHLSAQASYLVFDLTWKLLFPFTCRLDVIRMQLAHLIFKWPSAFPFRHFDERTKACFLRFDKRLEKLIWLK